MSAGPGRPHRAAPTSRILLPPLVPPPVHPEPHLRMGANVLLGHFEIAAGEGRHRVLIAATFGRQDGWAHDHAVAATRLRISGDGHHGGARAQREAREHWAGEGGAAEERDGDALALLDSLIDENADAAAA